MKSFFVYLSFSFFLLGSLFSAEIQVIKEGVVHEAFLSQEENRLVLQAIPLSPPPEIHEEIPNHDESELIWIPGYWAWSRQHDDFLWVTGILRRPPPRLQWISGYWKKFTEGWVWMPGYWASQYVTQADFISYYPPDSLDEKINEPPKPQESYFWIPGYWEFDSNSQEFNWLSGRWELLKRDWVYVPARYLWKDQGYIFIPGFWDHSMENRGVAHACIFVPKEMRTSDSELNLPMEVLQPVFIIELLFPYWPSYQLVYRNHFYFHYDLWISWGGFPPWWQWSTWWCYNWTDSWWLWWWWCRPGFPSPPWISAQVAQQIVAPPQFVIKLMQKAHPPVNVTPQGVIGDRKLINAMQIDTSKKAPILSSDPKQIQRIQRLAEPKVPDISDRISLRPEGRGKLQTPPAKVFHGPSAQQLKTPPRRMQQPKGPEQIRPRDKVGSSGSKGASLPDRDQPIDYPSFTSPKKPLKEPSKLPPSLRGPSSRSPQTSPPSSSSSRIAPLLQKNEDNKDPVPQTFLPPPKSRQNSQLPPQRNKTQTSGTPQTLEPQRKNKVNISRNNSSFGHESLRTNPKAASRSRNMVVPGEAWISSDSSKKEELQKKIEKPKDTHSMFKDETNKGDFSPSNLNLSNHETWECMERFSTISEFRKEILEQEGNKKDELAQNTRGQFNSRPTLYQNHPSHILKSPKRIEYYSIYPQQYHHLPRPQTDIHTHQYGSPPVGEYGLVPPAHEQRDLNYDIQGTIPIYEYPQTPMQLQHRDGISIHILPKSNPPGPKVHRFSDDHLTHPMH